MAADQVDRKNAVARRGTGKMSSVWISRASWDKVWSALHNIRVRIDSRVKSPSAVISGNGTSARINIDLPASGNVQTVYKGPFALSFSEDQKRVLVAAGYCNVNGEFFSVPEGSITLADRMKDGAVICLHVVKNTDTGKIETPEYCAADPDPEHYPLGRVYYKDNAWHLEQFYSAVAVFIFAEECKFAVMKGNLNV